MAIKNPQLKTNLKNIILLKDMHKTLWPEIILVKKMEKKYIKSYKTVEQEAFGWEKAIL